MRTTLNLPDDIYEEARAISHYDKIPLGEAIGRMVRGNFGSGRELRYTEEGLPYFTAPPGAAKVSHEHIKAVIAEMEDAI